MPRRLKAKTVLLPLVLLGAASACAPSAPGPAAAGAMLPRDAFSGAGDETRAAIFGTATAFASPAVLADRPEAAARAVAQLEFLAVEIPNGPRWVGVNPTVGIELAAARNDARAALGVAPTAPPQEVIDRLYGASRALNAGDRPAAELALNAPVFQAGGAATLRRLAALPTLPRANNAAVLAQSELWRLDFQDRPGGGGGGDGGGYH